MRKRNPKVPKTFVKIKMGRFRLYKTQANLDKLFQPVLLNLELKQSISNMPDV